jgi:hypothetical protein
MGISLMDMDRYVDATIEICEKWGIPYLDLYHDEELVDALHPYKKGSNGTKQYQTTYLYDFVHPSTLGFDLIYPYINEFLIGLIDPDYLEDKNTPDEPDIPDDPVDEPTDHPSNEPTDDPVDEPTQEPTQEPTDQPEDIPSNQPNSKDPGGQDKGGCGSFMGLSAVALCLMSAGVFAWSARKKEND